MIAESNVRFIASLKRSKEANKGVGASALCWVGKGISWIGRACWRVASAFLGVLKAIFNYITGSTRAAVVDTSAQVISAVSAKVAKRIPIFGRFVTEPEHKDLEAKLRSDISEVLNPQIGLDQDLYDRLVSTTLKKKGGAGIFLSYCVFY